MLAISRPIGTIVLENAKMMRPLLHVFPTFGIGGMQTQFATVANALADEYRHIIVSLDGRVECRSKLAIGTNYELADPPPMAASGLSQTPAIARFLRRQQAAAVITYNWGAVEWCLVNRMFGNAPGVHCEHGFSREEADRQFWRRSLFRRLALGRTTPLIVPSTTLQSLATSIWRIRPAQIHHIANGIDLAAMSRRTTATPAPFVRQPQEFVVGTVAPLREEKNLGRLLRVFARAADGDVRWRLAIAGDGPERARLEVVAHQLGIRDRVLFLGSLDEPMPALDLFDVFMLTSETEQMPYSILEAMALGKPVAATDVGDIAHMLCAENRPFVRPREDEVALARALRQLGDDADLRQRLGIGNRGRCLAEYTEDKMCAAFHQLYATHKRQG